MKLYKLPFIIKEADEDSGGKFVAEIPSLPGCRAWGDSAPEAVENLQSVTAAFIESHKAHGDLPPAEVEAVSVEAGARTVSELLVAV